MYSISNVKADDLSKIEVKHQDEIFDLVGKKLNPSTASEIIKKQSNGFKKADRKAAEADVKFLQLLKLNGINIKDGSKEKLNTSLNIQAQARARALSLLELELELELAA